MRPIDKAQGAFAAGQWGETIAACTEAISENPGDVQPYACAAGRRRLGQFQPAITDFTVAIQLMPKHPENYYLRAGVYRDQQEIDLADEDNRAGQKLDPTYQQAYLYALAGKNSICRGCWRISKLKGSDSAYSDQSGQSEKNAEQRAAWRQRLGCSRPGRSASARRADLGVVQQRDIGRAVGSYSIAATFAAIPDPCGA